MTTPPPYGGQYGGPYAGGPYGPPPPHPSGPDHPQATTVLVLGILSIIVCGLLGPFAWVLGSRALRDIDDSGGRIGGRSTVNAGRILGIISSVLLIVGVVFVVGIVALAAIGIFTSSS